MRITIILCAGVLAMTGCSTGQRSYTFGLNDNTSPFGFASRPSGSFAAPSDRRGNNATGRTVQSSQDRAPGGSYTKAPNGALSNRSYGQAKLDVTYALGQINSYRRKHGLKSVRLDALLTRAAKAHSRDLARWDRISHFGSDGSNPWERVKQAGYDARLAAENVGTGQTTFDEVMAGWKKSSGHNKNLLLRDAEHVGIALVYEPKTEFRTFWTLVMGAPG